MNRCRNCGAQLAGKFCSQCGQKASVKELNLHDIWHEAWHSLTHTDSGILKLIKDLFLHPRKTYLNYFAGQRKKYFSPVTFFLITAALLVFIGIKIFDYEDYRLKIYNEFGRLAFHETKFITLLLLPFEVLLTWAFFHRRFNLAKNIVFWLFLNGFLFTLKIAFTPFYFLFISHKHFLDNFILVLQFLFLLWHLIAVFGNRKTKNILAAFLVTNLIFILNFLVSGYLLFGDELMKWAKTDNLFQLILKAYQP